MYNGVAEDSHSTDSENPCVISVEEGAQDELGHPASYRKIQMSNGYHSDTGRTTERSTHDAIYGKPHSLRSVKQMAMSNGYHSDTGRAYSRPHVSREHYAHINGVVPKVPRQSSQDERVKDILQTSIANDAFCVDLPSRTNSTISLVRQVAPRSSSVSLNSGKSGNTPASDIALKVFL